MLETWKDVKDFPNYQVSNLGRVKSKQRITNVGIKNVKQICRKEKILKPLRVTKGYMATVLYNGKTRKIIKLHRLVAKTFIDNPKNLPQVNHKDGNKENNCVDNLEWCTQTENMKHSYDIGLRDREKLREKMRVIGKSKRGLEVRWRK